MGNKKRVLWVHNFPEDVSGGGNWMYNQYHHLIDDVDLYYLNNLRNPFYFIYHLFNLSKVARNYDIVHAQYGSAVGFLTSLVSVKKILSLKGSDWYIAPNPSLIHRIRIFIGNLLTKFSLKRFDYVIVMSNKMKSEVISKHGNLKNIRVIVDPINLDEFKPSNDNIIKNNKKVLFASVNLDNPTKRFDLAEKAFAELNKKMENVELITMTKIPRSEVFNYIKDMDVLLLTSTHEGWPNVVKEVLACNIPFVSTDVSDLKEIAMNTKNCFTCDSDSPEELGHALFKSLNSPRENLRRFVENFDMNTTLLKIKKIYNEI